MMPVLASCVYIGSVVHKRLRPKRHGLSYRVFSLLIALDELPELTRRMRLFSHNRFNLLSIHDRDYGDGSARPIAEQIKELAGMAGANLSGGRIFMLCYPRVFGYVFNPLTVYFCYASTGQLAVMIYEVSNTFGERHSYVLPAACDSGAIVYQQCTKQLYVSPFNPAEGRYTFHVRLPADEVAVGVLYRDGEQPTLKALFHGKRRALDDSAIIRLMCEVPLLSAKVMGAIHLEALRLWRKGLQLKTRAPAPKFTITIGRGGTASAAPPLSHAAAKHLRDPISATPISAPLISRPVS
jgi:uncharacterized protein